MTGDFIDIVLRLGAATAALGIACGLAAWTIVGVSVSRWLAGWRASMPRNPPHRGRGDRLTRHEQHGARSNQSRQLTSSTSAVARPT
jgi:hypothetical protein